MERDRTRRPKKKDGETVTTFPTVAGSDIGLCADAVAATIAGFTDSFQNGHGDGVTIDCLPESANAIVANIMQ